MVNPVIFHIGSFEVRWYGVLIMISFLVGIAIARKRAPRFGIQDNEILDASFAMLVAGVLGARVAFILQSWPYYSKHLSELFSLRFEGLTSFGGFIGGFLALLVWTRMRKVNLWTIADVCGVPLLVSNAIGRVGCLLNGCCYGVASTAPIAISVRGSHYHHLPAQLFETFMDLCFAWLVVRWEAKGDRRNGSSLGLCLALLGLGRFIYEFWRAGTRDDVAMGIASSTRIPGLPITEAHVVAALIAVAGVFLMVTARRNGENPATPTPSRNESE